MAHQVLQELSKHTININKCEELTLTWHESYITLLTEKGVHIFELSHNLKCLDKKIDCIQTIISHPKNSPSESLFSDRVVNKTIRIIEMNEMIVDQTLWPHNSQLLQEMSCTVDFKWSPIGAVNHHDSAIALLTNVGVVEIFVQHFNKWECALQISRLLTTEYMRNVDNPENLSKLKEIVHTLATTAMCWSPILNQDNSSYFVTAQKNGNVLLWLIKCRERDFNVKLIGSVKSGSPEIVSVLWVQNCETFFLICTNVKGQIIVLHCQVQHDTVQLIKSHTIWPDNDRMISKFIQYVEINNKIIIVCNKHRHLLVLMIDKECKVVGHSINNLNDYRISSISKTCKEIYITTTNCQIYKLDLMTSGEELDISLSSMEYHGLTATHELHSIAHSPNKTLIIVCAVDRKVNCRKEPMKVELNFTSTQEKLESLLEVLLLNPTKSLSNYWDVIEVLRYKTMKTKTPPAVEYEQLYEMACSDIYMLKLYLIFSTLCDTLKKIFKLGPEFYLPEDSIESVKEEILVAHADKLIHQYHEKYQQDGNLDDFEIEYFLGAKHFLEYFFKKNNKNLYQVIDPNILSIIDREVSYECQCCDSEVIGFKCKDEHINIFCALTFTPIHSNSYFVCKWCNLTAKKDLHIENPLCLFCDIHLRLVE